MNKLYQFRGYILGALALALLAVPGQPLPEFLVPAFLLPSGEVFQPLSLDQMEFYGIGLALYVVGALLRIKTRQYIGAHSRGSKLEADELVMVGPYAYTRHPLYFSNTLLAVGAIFIALGPNLLAFPFVLVVFAFEWILAREEDRFLEGKFGDTWRNWARETPMIPLNRIAIYKKQKQIRPLQKEYPRVFAPKRSFCAAFLADRSTWGWLLFFNLLLYLKKLYIG